MHNEEGWFAEMRIPFSSLRFQDQNGRVVMGLIAVRWIARNTEASTYPAIPPKWGFWSFVKPSRAQDVAFEGVHSRKPLYVTPYLLGGLGQNFRLNGTQTAYQRIDDLTYDVGLDVKYGLTNNLTLDLTVNTDFAQVEADDQQVNLTRFSLLFPEKRLFFQERASIFDFGAPEPPSIFEPGTSHQLFYSRRIGLYEGQPVRILGGARIVGRVGDWDIGVLDMQTARDSDLLVEQGGLPSENFGVARLRRQVFNPYSYAGGMATSRIGLDGTYNIAYGLDGLFRLFGDDYLSLAWAQTFEDGRGDAPGVLDHARMQARWERRTFKGFGYDLNFSRSGAAYDPGIGFVLRHGYTRFAERVFYGWLPAKTSLLQRHQVSVNSSVFLRNEDGSIESAEFGPAWKGALKSGAEFRATLIMSYEDLRRPFQLSEEAEVPEGSYTFYGLGTRYVTPNGKALRTTITATAGSFYDGQRLSLGVEPLWIVSRHLELSAFYGFNRVRFPEREQQVHIHLGRLRLQAALNTKLSMGAFIQYNSAIEAVITNVRFRYNPREGNDFYLVYNEGLNTNRFRVNPGLPFTSRRTILAKYTHTFAF